MKKMKTFIASLLTATLLAFGFVAVPQTATAAEAPTSVTVNQLSDASATAGLETVKDVVSDNTVVANINWRKAGRLATAAGMVAGGIALAVVTCNPLPAVVGIGTAITTYKLTEERETGIDI